MFRKLLRDQKGFTLIELVIVVTILSIIAGLAILYSGGAENDAKKAVAQADINSLATALKVFKMKTGSYPTSTEGLAALLSVKGSYQPMLDEIPKDPYDPANEYTYTVNADSSVTISSDGGISKTLK